MGEFAIGQSVSRFEDPRLLRGGGRYVGDIVLPGMVFGYVLRSPHAHARIRSIDTSKAKAAPGVLAVLTGADWQASGWGDLPVPGGLKRRDGSAFRPPYPALVNDRVRFSGDYVAFVVAESLIQAQDAAELISVDYEPLPAVVSTAEVTAAGAPRVWDQCPDNIGFVQLFGDKAATDAAFANAAHIVKHRFVINRVTAASMEPRGSIGDYNAAEDRYTIYTTLQRAHPFRTELAPILKVPESRIRVIAGDIGGSFGMKSAVYNEVALVLLASKRVGRPVKWTSTRSESFLCDAQARDNVTQAELALDRNGIFLGLRVHTIASIGAYLQTGMPAFTGNIGTLAGVYRTPAIHADITAVFTHTNPVRPYRGNGRPEAAYVIERLVDLAADELGIDPAELRRRNYIPPEAMPFKTGLTFTYDSGEFEKSMDMALALADFAGFERRRADARKRGKLRGRAGLRGRRDQVRQVRRGHTTRRQRHPGPGPRDDFQADRVRPPRARPERGLLHPRRHRSGVRRRGHRRLTLGDPRRIGGRRGRGEDHHQGQSDRRPSPRHRCRRYQLCRRRFLQPQDQSHADHQGRCQRGDGTDEASQGHGRRPDRDRDLCRAGAELPQRLPHLRARDRCGHRGSRDRALQRRGRRRHRHQSAAAEGTDRRRRRAGRRPGSDGGHQVRRRRPEPDRLVHGLRHAARDRYQRGRRQEQSGADQDQSARGQRRGRSGLRRRHARGRQCAGGRALPPRRPPRRDAGDAGAALARDARWPCEMTSAARLVPTPRLSSPRIARRKTRVNALMLGIHIPELVIIGPRFRDDDGFPTPRHLEDP